MTAWVNSDGVIVDDKCECIFWTDSGCVKPSYLNCPSDKEIRL